MTANIPGYEALCRDTVITSLLGGTPAAVPDRLLSRDRPNLSHDSADVPFRDAMIGILTACLTSLMCSA